MCSITKHCTLATLVACVPSADRSVTRVYMFTCLLVVMFSYLHHPPDGKPVCVGGGVYVCAAAAWYLQDKAKGSCNQGKEGLKFLLRQFGGNSAPSAAGVQKKPHQATRFLS